MSQLFPHPAPNGFLSSYGEEESLMGMAQCHQIWSRFFSIGAPNAPLSAHQKHELQRIVNGLSVILGAPLAIKWPGFSAHLKPLADVFPDAFYLFLTRDASAVIRSHYRGRQALLGSPLHPISRSPDCGHLKPGADPLEDIFMYIQAVNHAIKEASSQLRSGQFLSIDYEAFCAAPNYTLEQLRTKYQDWSGDQLESKDGLPGRFEASYGPQLSVAEEAKIRVLINADAKHFC